MDSDESDSDSLPVQGCDPGPLAFAVGEEAEDEDVSMDVGTTVGKEDDDEEEEGAPAAAAEAAEAAGAAAAIALPAAKKTVFLGKEQAKRRLQAFSAMKQQLLLNSPTKKLVQQQQADGKDLQENGEKAEEKAVVATAAAVAAKKKKAPKEKAKSVIDEIEEIKREEQAMIDSYNESLYRRHLRASRNARRPKRSPKDKGDRERKSSSSGSKAIRDRRPLASRAEDRRTRRPLRSEERPARERPKLRDPSASAGPKSAPNSHADLKRKRSTSENRVKERDDVRRVKKPKSPVIEPAKNEQLREQHINSSARRTPTFIDMKGKKHALQPEMIKYTKTQPRLMYSEALTPRVSKVHHPEELQNKVEESIKKVAPYEPNPTESCAEDGQTTPIELLQRISAEPKRKKSKSASEKEVDVENNRDMTPNTDEYRSNWESDGDDGIGELLSGKCDMDAESWEDSQSAKVAESGTPELPQEKEKVSLTPPLVQEAQAEEMVTAGSVDKSLTPEIEAERSLTPPLVPAPKKKKRKKDEALQKQNPVCSVPSLENSWEEEWSIYEKDAPIVQQAEEHSENIDDDYLENIFAEKKRQRIRERTIETGKSGDTPEMPVDSDFITEEIPATASSPENLKAADPASYPSENQLISEYEAFINMVSGEQPDDEAVSEDQQPPAPESRSSEDEDGEYEDDHSEEKSTTNSSTGTSSPTESSDTTDSNEKPPSLEPPSPSATTQIALDNFDIAPVGEAGVEDDDEAAAEALALSPSPSKKAKNIIPIRFLSETSRLQAQTRDPEEMALPLKQELDAKLDAKLDPSRATSAHKAEEAEENDDYDFTDKLLKNKPKPDRCKVEKTEGKPGELHKDKVCDSRGEFAKEHGKDATGLRSRRSEEHHRGRRSPDRRLRDRRSDRPRDTGREKRFPRYRDNSRERYRRDRDRDVDKGRDRDKDREKDREKDRDRNAARSRSLERHRPRDRDRDAKRDRAKKSTRERPRFGWEREERGRPSREAPRYKGGREPPDRPKRRSWSKERTRADEKASCKQLQASEHDSRMPEGTQQFGGASGEAKPSHKHSPISSPVAGFKKSVADSTISDSELSARCFMNEDRSPQVESSPKRISLDDRINMVLGIDPEPQPEPERKIDTVCSQGRYLPYNPYAYPPPPKPMMPYPPVPYQSTGTRVLQVGNVLQVVPTETPLLPPPPPVKPNVVQVGNMLQIVPVDQVPEQHHHHHMAGCAPPEMVPQVGQGLPPPSPAQPPPMMHLQQPPHPPQPEQAMTTKAIIDQLVAERRAEKEKRREEKERKRREKALKRKEREKRREAKMKHKTEELIKRALMETKEDIDLGELESEAPETSVVVTSLPNPPSKGILVTHGFSKLNLDRLHDAEHQRKSVKFADGIRPGEGTSPSGGEDLPSPPPPPRKVPKAKKQAKVKNKKKVKVKIIRTQPAAAVESDTDDDLPPPPPPPGSPPPHLWPPRPKPNSIHPSLPPIAFPPPPPQPSPVPVPAFSSYPPAVPPVYRSPAPIPAIHHRMPFHMR